MSNSLYSSLQGVSKKLLTSFGAAAVITAIRVTGTGPHPTSTTYTCTTTGVTESFNKMLVASGAVNATDRKLHIPGPLVDDTTSVEFSPLPGDKVTVDGKMYEVLPSEDINPGGQIILYSLRIGAS